MSNFKQPTAAALYNEYWGFTTDPQMSEQALIEDMYLQTLTELCINRFKWEGLPPEIDRRFIELQLHRAGLVVFFKDNAKIAEQSGSSTYFDRYFALMASGQGEINMYDNPTEFTAFGNANFQRTLDARDCVPIWGSATRRSMTKAVYIYARKLAKIDRTIDIVVEGLRYSKLVAANTNQRKSVVEILRQMEEGKPTIYTTPGFDPSAIQALDLGIHPDVLPKLMDSRNSLWNQAMGFLGINNANQDKRERLVASEVQANDEQVLAVRAGALNARQYAAEQINAMFPDLEIEVSFNQLDAMPKQPDGFGQFDMEGMDTDADVRTQPTGGN